MENKQFGKWQSKVNLVQLTDDDDIEVKICYLCNLNLMVLDSRSD